jgi:hypothetical protein
VKIASDYFPRGSSTFCEVFCKYTRDEKYQLYDNILDALLEEFDEEPIITFSASRAVSVFTRITVTLESTRLSNEQFDFVEKVLTDKINNFVFDMSCNGEEA